MLNAGFDNAGEDFKPADFDDTKPIAEYVIPESEAPVLDPAGNSTFNIGMRVSGGVISCYFNDQKVIDFNGYRGATTCTQLGSPVILWNTNCHCTFDNVVVSTPDYNRFNESADAAAPAANDGAGATEKVVETETRLVTDTDGNTVVEVVTNEVARPAANTGAATTGGTAARTGDSAIVVAAVMIVALGSAIVVKKVFGK